MTKVQHRFVIPGPSGQITGGNLFNEFLFAQLEKSGASVERIDPDVMSVGASFEAAAEATSPVYEWVDSLYLERAKEFASSSKEQIVGWILHYLPALVRHGENVVWDQLSYAEQWVLEHGARFVVPSEWMCSVLERLGVETAKIQVLVPGNEHCAVDMAFGGDARPPLSTEVSARTEALMVGNLLRGKGYLEWFEELGHILKQGSAPMLNWRLTIVGRSDMEPDYAAQVQEYVESESWRARIRWAGSVEPGRLSQLFTTSPLFVSASTMESYGMALAEARQAGCVVLARLGGNSRAHVESCAGGTLVDGAKPLAEEFVSCIRNPSGLASRVLLAQQNRTKVRLWSRVADEFVARWG